MKEWWLGRCVRVMFYMSLSVSGLCVLNEKGYLVSVYITVYIDL